MILSDLLEMMILLKQMQKLNKQTSKQKPNKKASQKAPSQAKECYNCKAEQDDPNWKMS